MKHKIILFFTGLFLVFAAPSSAAKGQLQELTEFLRNTKTLSTNFTQSYRQDGEQKTAYGKFFLQKPGKFRWEYKEPHEQLIIGDGDRIWVYEPDLRQASVKLQDDTLGRTPALLLSGGAELQKDFEIVGTSKESDLSWVMLAPKEHESGFKKVSFGIAGGVIKKMTLLDQFDVETTFSFSGLKMNPDLDGSLFRFEPDGKIDIIGDK